MQRRLTEADKAFIQRAVKRYTSNRVIFDALGNALFKTLTRSAALAPLIHSVKMRVKDPKHLKEKLERKIREKGRRGWGITEANLFQKLTDLVGLRILHLHTSQIKDIDRELQKCLKEEKYEKIEGPIAKTWDLEYKGYFQSLRITTEESPSQYTSVHYVFGASNDLNTTFELQVRTLAEELWGEVNHQLNYPKAHPAVACKEQIAVLARVTSSCTRLVDSIKRSEREHDLRKKRSGRRKVTG